MEARRKPLTVWKAVVLDLHRQLGAVSQSEAAAMANESGPKMGDEFKSRGWSLKSPESVRVNLSSIQQE